MIKRLRSRPRLRCTTFYATQTLTLWVIAKGGVGGTAPSPPPMSPPLVIALTLTLAFKKSRLGHNLEWQCLDPQDHSLDSEG